MARAEFEEKEYEMAFTIELAGKGGAVFSSGQVMEKIVGYDAVAHPDRDHLIWSLLNVPRPRGLRLVQPLWSPGTVPASSDLPSRPVSLILQYKRPDYLFGPAAAQWHFWHAPYYRFARTTHQHQVLRRLERRLGDRAIVRYAAPAFSSRAALEHRHLRRSVIEGSGFVSPRGLGNHEVWTYQGPGSIGRRNPRGTPLLFESFTNLVEATQTLREWPEPSGLLQELTRLKGGHLSDHVAAVGEAALYRNPTLRKKIAAWMSAVRSYDVRIDDITLARVADIASITTLMSELGGTWHVISELHA